MKSPNKNPIVESELFYFLAIHLKAYKYPRSS